MDAARNPPMRLFISLLITAVILTQILGTNYLIALAYFGLGLGFHLARFYCMYRVMDGLKSEREPTFAKVKAIAWLAVIGTTLIASALVNMALLLLGIAHQI
jgi:hypothetical protein